ncbi:MAG: hypothetical protein CL534_26380 [Ahrensia sp.]|nr:hypothetical protein [Ahrensia sp.]
MKLVADAIGYALTIASLMNGLAQAAPEVALVIVIVKVEGAHRSENAEIMYWLSVPVEGMRFNTVLPGRSAAVLLSTMLEGMVVLPPLFSEI